jgi:hypothetical protein
MESYTTEDMIRLKETLKKRVDELLSLRNRLAEYDSELINQFDQIELDLNRLFHLQGEEKSLLKNKLLFDGKQFAERIQAIASDLKVKHEDFKKDFDRFLQEINESVGVSSADLKTTLKTLMDIYKEHLDIFAGMEVIFSRYSATLKEKTEQFNS